MRYIQSENKLFIHIPRTGGVSVEKAINEKFEGSPDVKNVRVRWRAGRHVLKDSVVCNTRLIGDPVELFTFTVVRHPVDWYLSNWRFLQRAYKEKASPLSWIINRQWHPKQPMIESWDEDFGRWIDKLFDKHPAYYTRLCEMYCGPEGEEFVDYIGRTETLEEDVRAVLGPGIKVERANRSAVPSPHVGSDHVIKINHYERVVLERFYSERTMDFRHAGDWKR